MIIGCYVLDLYCADPEHQPWEDGRHGEFGKDCEHGSQARAQARRAGWKLDLENGTALCPKHAKETSR